MKSTGLRGDYVGGELGAETLGVVQAQEEKILLLTLWFTAKVPRNASKKTRNEGNSVHYSLSLVPSVRVAAERELEHQVGMAGSSTKRSTHARAVAATLAGEGPIHKEPRCPVLRSHLEWVKRVLDLDGSGLDRVAWAVVLCFWFAALRVGDLLGSEALGKDWNPSRRTHRGRLTVAASGSMERGLNKLVLVLKPTKTDQRGQMHLRQVFKVAKDWRSSLQEPPFFG